LTHFDASYVLEAADFNHYFVIPSFRKNSSKIKNGVKTIERSGQEIVEKRQNNIKNGKLGQKSLEEKIEK